MQTNQFMLRMILCASLLALPAVASAQEAQPTNEPIDEPTPTAAPIVSQTQVTQSELVGEAPRGTVVVVVPQAGAAAAAPTGGTAAPVPAAPAPAAPAESTTEAAPTAPTVVGPPVAFVGGPVATTAA